MIDTMRQYGEWLGAVSVAGILAACASGLVNPQIPPPGSLAFRDGYVDGCPSGFRDANRDGYEQAYRKADTRYTREPDYKSGWDQGHAACFAEEQRHPKSIGAGGTEPGS